MPGLCHCVSTATRNRVNLHNNLCKHCGKKFRKISSDNENFADSEEYFYENTKDILEGSPNYTNNFDGNQTFSNFDESKHNCNCDSPDNSGKYCSKCGGLPLCESPKSHLPVISKDDSNCIFGSLKNRPITNLRRSRSFVDLPNEELYTRIPAIPFQSEDNIEPLELQNFAENFQLNIPDDLNLFINRQIDIVREIEPDLAGQIIQDLNRQNEAEVGIEPQELIIDNNPAGIEILYDDVENIDMNMLRFQNLRIPRFDAKKSNVRKIFRKFEQFRDGQIPIWDNDVTINMLENVMDDDSLDYFDSLPEEIRGNYENLRGNMVEHYDTGSPLCTQWHDLNHRVQRENETVTQFHDELLKLARPMNLAVDQILLIFINGLDEIQKFI